MTLFDTAHENDPADSSHPRPSEHDPAPVPSGEDAANVLAEAPLVGDCARITGYKEGIVNSSFRVADH